jgi:hypothetical protein
MTIVRLSALVSGLVYLAWRAAFTWSGANPALFIALLAAEAFGVARLWLELGLTGTPRELIREPARTDPPPTDLYVVVNDEPTSEVRAALVSARTVEGVETIILIDRSDRVEVAELADRLEISRIVGTDSDGDVGELLTAAMRSTSAELIAVVPADVVVLPDLVATTAAAFDDPEVGVVVGRIEATNAENTIDLPGYGEQALRDVLATPLLDDAHSLPWWSGVSLVRREALEQIGGFVPGRLHATLATGVRLHVGGWRMTDVPVVVGRRLAPWTDSRQLHRWSRDLHERLDLARRADISWSSTRITPMMRRIYASAAVPALRGVQRIVLFAVLFATAAGAGLPLVAPVSVFFVAWSTRMALGVAARWFATRSVGFVPWITVDLRLLATDLAVLGNVIRRRPLADELIDAAPGLRMRGLMTNGLVATLALVIAVHGTGVVDPPMGDLATVSLLLCAAWLLAALIHARQTLQHRQRRMGFRASTNAEVNSADSPMTVVGISPLGLDVVSTNPLWVGAPHRLVIDLPRADGTTKFLDASTIVRHSKREHNGHVAFLRFAQMSDEETDRLIEFCAVVDGHHDLRVAADSEAATVDGLHIVAMDENATEPDTEDEAARRAAVGAWADRMGR